MKTLVTGAFSMTTEFRNELEQLGMDIMIHPDERFQVEHPEIYEAVICNGLFLYNDISLFKELKIIQLTSVGYDRVPMEFANEHQIIVFNARDAYSIPMAEFAICGILQFYKQAPFFFKNKEEHRWEKHRSLRDLYGKNVLIVGTGNVGCEIAKRLRAFNCNITGVNRTPKHSPYFDKILPLEQLESIVPTADIIVLAIALTSETKHLLNASLFNLVKNDALLVNISRGALIDETALVDWLDDHSDAGVILDVYETEPLDETNSLWNCSNAILTPHNSFVGEENKKRLERVIYKNFEKTQKDGLALNGFSDVFKRKSV